MSKNIWGCKIGENSDLDWSRTSGLDLPMRRAVQAAYFEITGSEDDFCFSGWGGKLTESERAAYEDRLPNNDKLPLGAAEARALLAAIDGEDFDSDDFDSAVAKLHRVIAAQECRF